MRRRPRPRFEYDRCFNAGCGRAFKVAYGARGTVACPHCDGPSSSALEAAREVGLEVELHVVRWPARAWARQFRVDADAPDLMTWSGDPAATWTRKPHVFSVTTKHGSFSVEPGDWLLKGEDGLVFAVLRDDVFPLLYRAKDRNNAGP